MATDHTQGKHSSKITESTRLFRISYKFFKTCRHTDIKYKFSTLLNIKILTLHLETVVYIRKFIWDSLKLIHYIKISFFWRSLCIISIFVAIRNCNHVVFHLPNSVSFYDKHSVFLEDLNCCFAITDIQKILNFPHYTLPSPRPLAKVQVTCDIDNSGFYICVIPLRPCYSRQFDHSTLHTISPLISSPLLFAICPKGQNSEEPVLVRPMKIKLCPLVITWHRY